MIAAIGHWALGLAALVGAIVVFLAAMWLFFSEEGQEIVGALIFVAISIAFVIAVVIGATYGLWSLGIWVQSLF